MTGLTLYTNPMSRGRIARWMLEEVGAPYERVVLGYDGAMKDPDFLAINPMGKVPTIRHGETVVTETAAVCAYLADSFPDAGLAPPLADRGAYYRWLFFAAGPLEAAVTNASLGADFAPGKAGSLGYGTLETTLDTLEQALTGHDYLAADHFTAADLYVGSHLGWGMMFGSIPARPAFGQYRDRLYARPAYLRAAALDDADMPTPA
ncbi:glutathione S-transferase family protein [Sphingomonas prati]|uniref:Glutathione S-transferase n=1 Tax=Sphingomonas prati TaxID=1843237 RepID=A0A7W9BV29_9SPHN|nr:glutathione S-transferase family protein [Sphingomonas prati]MBB5730555.1 glutathione S-transferase [Sphingomonas prati]GGE94931.1 glutathione S-transferase [Sphingomonas prati]